MLPITTGAFVTRHLIACEYLGPNAIHSQLIRWKRKPLWLGTAKSKIFRVPVRPVIPTEEVEEIKRLSNNYRTYRSSIKRYLMDQVAQSQVQFDEAVVQKLEEQDFKYCNELNDAWNKEVCKTREARHAAEIELRKQQVSEKIIAKEKRDKLLMEEVDEKVRKAKIASETFITAENIDEAIDKALGTIVNYNVAIDSQGNRYEGKYEPKESELPRNARLRAEQ